MIIEPRAEFKKEIARTPDGASVQNCYLCGTCTAGCPVAEIDGAYSPRTIMRLTLAGAEKELLTSEEIWKCSQCGRCTAHCPQHARPSDVIKAVRDAAVAAGVCSKEKAARLAALENELNTFRLNKIAELLKETE